MLALKLILIILCVLLLLLVVGISFFFIFAHYRRPMNLAEMGKGGPVWDRYKKLMDDGIRWIGDRETETVEIQSFDGLKLRGTFIPVDNPRACVLMMHGYNTDGFQDLAALTPFYAGLGCSILLIDQRACGKSEGKIISFGIKERQDALSWTRYLDERFSGKLPILMHGLSLGAATVMMASNLPLPERVCGIVADCGFTSPAAIISHCGYQWFKIPSFPMINILSFVVKLIAGFGYWDCDTTKTLSESDIPVFLIHGAKDDFVPSYMTELNYKAAKSCRGKLIVDDASHAVSYMMAQDRYEALVSAFLNDVIQ